MTFRTVDKSQTLLLNEQSRQLEGSGVEVVKFGFGQSPFSPPEGVMQAYRDNVSQHHYSPVQGLPELREAAARFHQQLDGIEVTPENILVAPGSKMLIYAMIGMFERVDVLIPAPAWVSYAPQAALWNQNIIRVEADFASKWNITPQSLEAAVAQKADATCPSVLILNYPGNPSGVTYTAEELEAIAAVCRKHQIYVISDEIYGLLHHHGEHRSIWRYYPERTMITTGLSKWCGSGGWRVGIALLPDTLAGEVKETLLGIASETYSCNSTPAQIAAVQAYQVSDDTAHYLTAQRKVLQAIGQSMARELSAAGVRVHAPEGGFYLLPDFSAFREKLSAHGVTDSESLCSKLLAETGIALLPGNAFGLSPETLAARLAYVDFDGNQALHAIAELAEGKDDSFIERYAPKIIAGTQRITSWLERL